MSERLISLEQRFNTLSAQIGSVRREGEGVTPTSTRIARAVDGPSTYPTSGNTFYIMFLDGEYTRTPGNNTPTLDDRYTSATAVCHNLANTMPPENTVLHVFEWGGYWWTNWSDNPTTQKIRIGKVRAAPIPFGSVGTIDVWTSLADTGVDLGVTHDWVNEADSLPVGTRVIAAFFEDEGIWRIIYAPKSTMSRSVLSLAHGSLFFNVDETTNELIPFGSPGGYSVTGSAAGVSWNVTADALTFEPGEYLLTFSFNGSPLLNSLSQEKYAAGHPDEGHWVAAGYRVDLREPGGVGQIPHSIANVFVQFRNVSSSGSVEYANAERTVRIINSGGGDIDYHFWVSAGPGTTETDARMSILTFAFHVERL